MNEISEGTGSITFAYRKNPPGYRLSHRAPRRRNPRDPVTSKPAYARSHPGCRSPRTRLTSLPAYGFPLMDSQPCPPGGARGPGSRSLPYGTRPSGRKIRAADRGSADGGASRRRMDLKSDI